MDELIESLQSDLSKLPHRDSGKLDALLKRCKMIIVKLFGQESGYLVDLSSIHFSPMAFWEGMSDHFYDQAWNAGVIELTNLLQTMKEDLGLNRSLNQKSSQRINRGEKGKASERIFLVHGHDNEMKVGVARTLETLALEPIILHEQPDRGLTVIEKFEKFSDVGFAVVLLSPDDLAYTKDEASKSARPRARQNVILELGFFLGKLGRAQVFVLYREVPKFEVPSDYVGVLFKRFDKEGAWRFELVKELNACGYKVDANGLL